MKYDLVLFDFDGTLMDTSEGIFYCARMAMRDLNLEIKPGTDMNVFVGPPLVDCFKLTFGLEEELAQKASEIYRGYYFTEGRYKARFYPNVLKTLAGLKDMGMMLGIATNKHTALAKEMAEYFGLSPYFDGIYGGSRTRKITKTQIIERAIERLGVKDRSRILMVGDTELDMNGAKQQEVDFLGVSFGFGLKGEVLGLQYPLLNDYLELLSFCGY